MTKFDSELDVVVIGAGAAGLAAGRRLLEAGVRVLVLEARKRRGGRAVTQATALGHAIDLGCEWLHSADRNPWTALARGLGFTVDETLPNWGTRVAYRHGSDAQAEWLKAYGAFEERLEATAKAGQDRAAAELLPAQGRWNGLIDAISTWANGVELDRLSVQDHARYADSGINWRVIEGYGTLIAAYGAPVPVQLEAKVRHIDHSGRSIAVATDGGTVRAMAVIVTVPTNVLAEGAIGFTPALPDKIAAAAGLPLGVANKLFLALEGEAQDFPRDHHSVGATDRTATGSYHIRPHGWPMITGYFGGRLAIELERRGPDAMAAFALDELAGLYGSALRRQLKPLASSAWVADPFARGSYSHALPGHADDRARLAAPIDNRLFFAGEACSAHDFSTAHGAYLTGYAAAGQVLAALGRAHTGSSATAKEP